MQEGRVVYQHASSAATYIFYWPSSSNWRIGSSYTSGSAGVRSTDGTGALCPDLAAGWEALSTSSIWLPWAIAVAPVPGQTLPPSLATGLTPGPTTTPTTLPTWNTADPSGDAIRAWALRRAHTHEMRRPTRAHAALTLLHTAVHARAHTHARTHTLAHTQVAHTCTYTCRYTSHCAVRSLPNQHSMAVKWR